MEAKPDNDISLVGWCVLHLTLEHCYILLPLAGENNEITNNSILIENDIDIKVINIL